MWLEVPLARPVFEERKPMAEFGRILNIKKDGI